MTTVLCLKYWSKMGQMKDFAVPSHYVRTTTEGSKSSKCSSQKYMPSIREASAYFNIGVKKMRRMAEDNEGEFSLFMGNWYLADLNLRSICLA